MRLESKVVLVTGGASGIGRAAVDRLARDGAHIIVADIQAELASEVVRHVKDGGGSAEVCELDVAAEGAAAAAVASIVAAHGRLDGAFNNAGIVGPTTKLLEIKAEEWAQVLAVNLTSVFSCLQAEIAQMIQQESGGSIVNTASICGLVALPHASAYNAAKHGIVGLTKSSALEYGPQNIRVNAVCPGFIDTPMLAKGAGANAQVLEGVVRTIPMRRVAGANEVADVVAWLLSAQSSYVSGVAMPIDGGWVVQ
ncbi:MAG: SDR family NAD(P)-dependent oxidoreductase [Pseudomonadales bacterium]|jgi:NAD(P)-dependent dehydrogenase (short-subunit alcohol dehydrogenase family)|nr:SDR family NAD(P)-dependent oxidoreductase [Pseudomonadales bacterium]